jgi:hypothetical protein
MEAYAISKIFENIKFFTNKELDVINKNRVLTTKLCVIYMSSKENKNR